MSVYLFQNPLNTEDTQHIKIIIKQNTYIYGFMALLSTDLCLDLTHYRLSYKKFDSLVKSNLNMFNAK
jgi:hypothetical protein